MTLQLSVRLMIPRHQLIAVPRSLFCISGRSWLNFSTLPLSSSTSNTAQALFSRQHTCHTSVYVTNFITTSCKPKTLLHCESVYNATVRRLKSNALQLMGGSDDGTVFHNMPEHAARKDKELLHPAHELETSGASVIVGDDPKRELVVFVGGELTSVKAVDLYRMIRRMDKDQVLSLIERSPQVLDKIHLSLALKRLFALSRWSHRQSPSDVDFNKLLLSDYRFQILCALLARKARFLEPAILADMLVFLIDFGMSSKHPAMQICLQLAMKQINNLTLDQLANIVHSLGYVSPTKQTMVLTEATRVLCQTRQFQLPQLSVEQKIYLLDAFGPSLGYVDDLLSQLWRDRFDINTWHQALAFFAAMGKMAGANRGTSPTERHWKLEAWCLETIRRQLIWLNADDLKTLLVAYRQLKLRNKDLLHLIGQQAVDGLMNTEARLTVWSLLADLSHLHLSLSSTVLDGINMECLNLLSPTARLSLLRLIAEMTNREAVHTWQSAVGSDSRGQMSVHSADGLPSDKSFCHGAVVDILVEWMDNSCSELIQEFSPELLLDACLYVTALHRTLSASLVDHVIQYFKSFSSETFSEDRTAGLTLADRLILLIHTSKPKRLRDSDISRLAKTATDNVKLQSSQSQSSLTAALKLKSVDAVHQYVTSSGFRADHLVLGRSADQPSTAVFSWYSGQQFWRNTYKLQRLPYLYVTALQALHGHRLVVVNTSIWLKLGDREKLEYLTNALVHDQDRLLII